MNSILISNIIRFLTLLFFQVALCNNILLFDLIEPQIYIIFILLYPLASDRTQFILISFFLGLCIDFFENTGGAHAAACLVIAYIRPFIIASSFGNNYEEQNLKLNKDVGRKHLLYVFLLCFIHHIVLYSLEVFDFNFISYTLLQTIGGSLFSSILIITLISLFYNKSSKLNE